MSEESQKESSENVEEKNDSTTIRKEDDDNEKDEGKSLMEDSGAEEDNGDYDDKNGLKRPRDKDGDSSASDGEGEGEENNKKKNKKKKSSKKRKEEEDEDDEEDDEDDDEEDQDHFEDDGFVVADGEEDEEPEEEDEKDGEDDEEAKKQKRKRHRMMEDDELEEGDISVIKDTNPELYNSLMRKKKQAEKKKGKRLRKAESDDDDESEDDESEEEEKPSKTSEERSGGDQMGESSIVQTLFADTNPVEEEESEEEPEEDKVEEDDEDALMQDGSSSSRKRHMSYDNEGVFEAQEFFSQKKFDFDDDDDDEDYNDGMRGDEDEDEVDDSEAEVDELHNVSDETALLRAGYEPHQLAGKFLNETDMEIQKEDFPERFLLRRYQLNLDHKTLETVKANLDKEAQWILTVEFSDVLGGVISREEALKQVTAALRFFRVEGLEPYYVHLYRRTEVENLTLPQLWTIYDRDTEFLKMAKIKTRLLQMPVLAQMKEFDRAEIERTIEDARSEQELEDISDNLTTMTYAAEAEGAADKTDDKDDDVAAEELSKLAAGIDGGHDDEGLFNDYDRDERDDVLAKPKVQMRALRYDQYSQCCRNNLRELANRFCLSAAQFSENVDLDEQKNIPPDPEETPESLAQDHVRGMFSTPESVLRGVRSMIAREIADDCRIRRVLLHPMYERDVVVNTEPVPGRAAEMTLSHPFAVVKRVRNKHISDFSGDVSFLTMLRAEKEGFIKVDLHIPSESHKRYIEVLQKLFGGVGTNAVAQQWQEQRLMILDEALRGFVYPTLAKQVRRKLLKSACNVVISRAAAELKRRVNVLPFDADKSEDEQTEYLASFAIDDNSSAKGPAVTCVMVDRFGQPHDFITLHNIALPENRRRSWDSFDIMPQKADDVEKLRKFLRSHHSLAAAIPASSPSAYIIEKVLKYLRNKGTGSDDKGIDEHFDIIYVDPSVPNIFARSERAEEEFSRNTVLFRRAVSVGRLAQNPLAEYCALCQSDGSKELLYLPLDPNLRHIIKVMRERCLEVLQRVLCDVVASVGVNIVDVTSYPCRSGLIQFVPGLGPRKARSLFQFARGGISSRKALESIFGKVVFANCAPFLRFLSYSSDHSNPVDYLDGTRISPEHYDEVGILVAKAMKREYAKSALSQFLHDGKKLEKELHTSVSKYYEKQTKEKKALLEFIAKEFDHPFQDPRNPFEKIEPVEVKKMLIGKNLQIGDPVSVTVVSVQGYYGHGRDYDYSARGTMFNGLFEANMNSMPVERSSIGSVVNCYIKSVSYSRLSADVTDEQPIDIIRKRLLDQEKFLDLETPDPVSDPAANENVDAPQQVRFPRAFKHVLFRNATHADVVKELEGKSVGSVLIRPSGSNDNTLVMCWKMNKHVIAMINIEELNKACPLFIGRRLRVDGQVFGDIDELYGTYIEPMNETAKEVSRFRYFRKGDKKTVDDLLVESKKENPKRTPYFISISDEHPGKYVISFLPGNTPRHIYFSIGPGKLVIRDKVFANTDQLIAYFKTHSEELLKPERPHDDRDRDDSRHSYRYHDSGYDDRHHHHHHHRRHRHSYSRSRSRSNSYSRSRSRSGSRSRHGHSHYDDYSSSGAYSSVPVMQPYFANPPMPPQ